MSEQEQNKSNLLTYDENLLLDDAFDALRHHFKSREGFLAEYVLIPDSSSKHRFLRLASIYKNLVKDGNFSVPPVSLSKTNVNYYNITYKYIALISIIEAIFAKDEYLDFYEWLIRLAKTREVFPINDPTALYNLFEQFKLEYGVIKNAVKFFQALDIKEQKFLQTKLVRFSKGEGKVSEIESTITQLAQLLYNIRSEFMHNAKLIVEFSDVPSITTNRKTKPFTSTLTLNQLALVFELGFMRHFGMRPESEIWLFETPLT